MFVDHKPFSSLSLRSLWLRSGILLHLSALVIWYKHCSVHHDRSLRYPP